MDEVEYLCNELCIMDEGKIIASGTRQELVELVREKTRINIKLNKMDEDVLTVLRGIEGVVDAKKDEDSIALFGSNADVLLADIISRVSEKGWLIETIDVKKPNLKAVFLHLTGKALRD